VNQNLINTANLYSGNTGFSSPMAQTVPAAGGMFQTLLDDVLLKRLQTGTAASSQTPASNNLQSDLTAQWVASMLQSLPVPGMDTGNSLASNSSWLGATSSMQNLLSAMQPSATPVNTTSNSGSVTQAAPAQMDPFTLKNLAKSASDQYGIPVQLILSVIHQESGGNPNAISSAGAQGLMQLMPDTAAALGVTNVFDPVQNVNAGTHYLAQLLNRFRSVPLALAAYNAGPEAVTRYQGIPPYAETQNYVQSILGQLRHL
jgi:soluble lytic murein transglycosylase-like protein